MLNFCPGIATAKVCRGAPKPPSPPRPPARAGASTSTSNERPDNRFPAFTISCSLLRKRNSRSYFASSANCAAFTVAISSRTVFSAGATYGSTTLPGSRASNRSMAALTFFSMSASFGPSPSAGANLPRPNTDVSIPSNTLCSVFGFAPSAESTSSTAETEGPGSARLPPEPCDRWKLNPVAAICR